MKKILIFLYFLTANFIALAQDLNGIGAFRIGMDVESFLRLPEIETRTIKAWSFDSDLIRNPRDLFKNTNAINVRLKKIYSPNIIDFYFMTELAVMGDYYYPASARFYNNKLISISIENATTELGKLLAEKYGEPRRSGGIKKTICQNKFGAQYFEYDGREKLIWKTNSSIHGILTNWAFCGNFYPNSSEYTVEHIKNANLATSEELRISETIKKEDLKKKALSSQL